ASRSQQTDDASFRMRPIRAQDQDLGSRDILREEKDLIWYPAEVNTSIRPGWFWHEAENNQVKPLSRLIDIYEKSVGGNATFLLNIPPNREGLLDTPDVRRLQEFGHYLRSCYARNLAQEAVLEADAAEPAHEAEKMLVQGNGFYLPAVAYKPVRITLRWSSMQPVDRVVVQEEISQTSGSNAFIWRFPMGRDGRPWQKAPWSGINGL
ncbi:MAG: alpha-L-fucosidase, partial [Clostridia bacterium]|nr:alpha-L-fucosidase [Clostridia bacterium]